MIPPVSASVSACKVINERFTASGQSVGVVNRSAHSCQYLAVSAIDTVASIAGGSGSYESPYCKVKLRVSPTPIVNSETILSFLQTESIGVRNITRSGPTIPRIDRRSALSRGGILA